MRQLAVMITGILCILNNTIPVYSANLISDVVVQNNFQYGFDHSFGNEGPLKFSLINPQLSGKWACELKSKDGSYIGLPCDQNESTCLFDPMKVGFKVWQSKAFRKLNSDCTREDFILKVSYRSNNGEVDEREVVLSLLPDLPIINNVNYDVFDYDWEHNSIYPNGIFSFDVTSDGADSFWLYFTKSFLFSDDNLFFSFSERFIAEDEIKIEYDADWGEYICVDASNQFGYVRSDTIFTTDFIKDERILERIEELKRRADVRTVQADSSVFFTWNNSILKFEHEMTHIKVYANDGCIALACTSGKELDMSFLSSGIYIVTYFDGTTNKFNNLKILKR